MISTALNLRLDLTPLSTVCDALDRLHTTAESHNRVLVCEVMGRNTGWLACYGGIAGGADFILVPEKPIAFNVIVDGIKKRHSRGKDFSILVVAEGVSLEGYPQDGESRNGGVGEKLARLIAKETGYETRAMVLGHIQRGGSPTAFDRVLATRSGILAANLAHQKKFGTMVALRGNQLIDVSIVDAVEHLKTLDMDLYQDASVFFG